MNIINVSVNFEKRQIQRTGVNLTSGDYNSTKIVFEFDKDYAGRKVFELANPSGDIVLVQEIPDNNEVVLVGYIDGKEVSIFNEVGKYIFEISLYEENSKLTSASSSLKIKQEQITVGDEIVQAYLPIFDTLMQDVEKSIASLENVEKEVADSEELRKVAEIERENSENTRAESEIKREEAEENRNTTETVRQNNETARKTAETEREDAESARADSETTRNNNEEQRQKNETVRSDNEASRQTNELLRINNEDMREEKIRMIENALKDVIVEGTNINIQDSADWYAKIKLKGKSEQNGIPTPDTPIEIENIEGNVEVKVIGKNFCSGIVSGLWNTETKELGSTASTVYKSFSAKLKAGTYTLSSNTSLSIVRAFTDYDNSTNVVFGGNQSNITSYQFVITEDTTVYITVRRYNNTDWLDTDLLQLEKGTVATEYVPYNSLAVKVTGKNLAKLNDGNLGSFYRAIYGIPVKAGDVITYVVNFDTTQETDYMLPRIYSDKALTNLVKEYQPYIYKTQETIQTITITDDGYFTFAYGYSYETLTFDKLFVGKGTYTIDDYEEYKEQTVYFPLQEGQTLMEGSELTGDGVYNKHNQQVVNIISITTLSNGNIAGVCNIENKILKNNNYLACSKAIFTKSGETLHHQEGTVYENQENIAFVGNTSDTLETLKEKYDGATIEYELAEEEIVPYTEEQQEAWDNMQKFKTYKTVTNIISDAPVEATYKKDLQTQLNELEALILESGV